MRIGSNPNKDKELQKSEFIHQVIVPVHIPHQEEYFKDSFKILKLCLESLFITSHAKTYFTVVNNGSCQEIVHYLNQLHQEKKIHEVIHTSAIGKLNAILKGLTGHQFELVTISDADVLFLNNWQKATYEVFEAFPKAGVVSTTPSSKVLKLHTSNTVISQFFSKNLSFTEVVNPNAMQKFATSIGNVAFYKKVHLNKFLTVTQNDIKAVVGAGHFVATYKGSVFQVIKETYSPYALGGTSELLFLDKPVEKLGYWRLSTADNYTYHMGNVTEDWMQKELENLKLSTNDFKASFVLNNNFEKNRFLNSNFILFKFLSYGPIWKLFLRYKGLTKVEAEKY